jgi:hypothetical protein
MIYINILQLIFILHYEKKRLNVSFIKNIIAADSREKISSNSLIFQSKHKEGMNIVRTGVTDRFLEIIFTSSYKVTIESQSLLHLLFLLLMKIYWNI